MGAGKVSQETKCDYPHDEPWDFCQSLCAQSMYRCLQNDVEWPGLEYKLEWY